MRWGGLSVIQTTNRLKIEKTELMIYRRSKWRFLKLSHKGEDDVDY